MCLETKELDLCSGPIVKTLIKLSVPVMLTAFISMAYNLTDVFWIGNINDYAVSGAGVIGFLMWIESSIALLPAIGGGVLFGHARGNQNKLKENKVIFNSFWLAMVIGILFLGISYLGISQFISFYQMSDRVNVYAYQYFWPVSYGMIFAVINPLLSQIYQNAGNSMTPFKINAFGLIANIILDPLLMFGFNLGIYGAGLATSLAQIIVFGLFMVFSFRSKNYIYQALSKCYYSFKVLKRVVSIGFFASIRALAHVLVSIILSRMMSSYGDLVVAVYTVGAQLESLTWMSVEGFCSAISAMVAQNFGANLFERVKEIAKKGMLICLSMGLVSMLILMIFRYQLISIFLSEPEAISLGVVYLLSFGSTQMFSASELCSTSVQNGIGNTKVPSILSMIFRFSRLLFAGLLIYPFGVYGIWYGMCLEVYLNSIIQFFVLKFNLSKL